MRLLKLSSVASVSRSIPKEATPRSMALRRVRRPQGPGRAPLPVLSTSSSRIRESKHTKEEPYAVLLSQLKPGERKSPIKRDRGPRGYLRWPSEPKGSGRPGERPRWRGKEAASQVETSGTPVRPSASPPRLAWMPPTKRNSRALPGETQTRERSPLMPRKEGPQAAIASEREGHQSTECFFSSRERSGRSQPGWRPK